MLVPPVSEVTRILSAIEQGDFCLASHLAHKQPPA
jgi:hypothetical protein